MKDVKGCKTIYQHFLECVEFKPKHELKWEHALRLNVDKKWWQKPL